MENASHAFLDAVRKSMRHIRVAIGAAKIDPDLLTAAETIQYEGYLRREDTNAVILGLAKDGVTIKEIVRRTGYSRGLARKVLRGERSDVFRVRESSLEVYLPWLDAQWAIGGETARTYGDSSNSRAFAEVFGWSRNGPHAGDERTRPTSASSVALPRPELSPAL